MNENIEARRPMTLREKYGRNRGSKAWQEWPEHPPIVTFRVDGEEEVWWGVPFINVVSVLCQLKHLTLSIECKGVGTFVLRGPKVLELAREFNQHQASEIKTDGMDLLSVELILP
jgi:hypothetical protein